MSRPGSWAATGRSGSGSGAVRAFGAARSGGREHMTGRGAWFGMRYHGSRGGWGLSTGPARGPARLSTGVSEAHRSHEAGVMPPQPHRPAALAWQVFRGSDAIRHGLLTRHQLRGAAWLRLRPRRLRRCPPRPGSRPDLPRRPPADARGHADRRPVGGVPARGRACRRFR